MRRMEDFLWHVSKVGRFRFWYQIRHRKGFLEVFVGLNNALAMGVLGLIAHLTSWPLLFPSLGPSLFLIFYSPQRPMSSPRNTFLAHLLGGTLGLAVFRLLDHLHLVASQGFDPGRALSAALVLGTFGFVMVRLRILHPPAASTALIAATGYLPHWYHLLILALATGIVILQAQVLHRLSGIEYPRWAPATEEEPEIFTAQGRFRMKEGPPEDLRSLAEQVILKGKPHR